MANQAYPTLSHPLLSHLETELQPLRQTLLEHPLYERLGEISALRLFMEHHVFAVWDFMSLLKALQRSLSCVEIPWVPRGPVKSRRLILEIVLGEECDEIDSEFLSHFELYRRAMRECGANTAAIQDLIGCLEHGEALDPCLEKIACPEAARHFVRQTWGLVSHAEAHVLAGVFTFGREDLIPKMFRPILENLNRQHDGRLQTFLKYLDRHVQLDAEQHHPMALAMVTELCGDDPRRWEEVRAASQQALRSRLALWDGIVSRIEKPKT